MNGGMVENQNLKKIKKKEEEERCFLVGNSIQTVKFLLELCQIWLAPVKFSLN